MRVAVLPVPASEKDCHGKAKSSLGYVLVVVLNTM